jgi:disulfide bond formation protein DsbB
MTVAVAAPLRAARALALAVPVVLLGGAYVSQYVFGLHPCEMCWWQGMTACTSTPFAAGVDPMDAILNAPVIRCDVAPWTLGGISLAGFNFLISTLGALAVFGLVARSRKVPS